MFLIMSIFVLLIPISLVSVRGSAIPQSKKMTEGRIIGGRNVTIEEYPYQVIVFPHRWELILSCGGSLIKENLVLTSVFCYTEGFKYSVRAGSNKINEGGEVINVTSFLLHPKYHEDSLDYDVAVVILEKSFTLSDKIQLVKLVTVGSEVPDGKMGTVLGWGITEDGSTSKSKILQAVDVPKLNFNICKVNYEKRNFELTDRMMCFGYADGGQAPCRGAWGGPLVVDGVQVAVTSWAKGCGRPHVPALYMKIANSEINDFIQEHMS